MIDYKTIISTTDSKVTLMQWLQALTEEFGEAKIKSVVFDVTTSRLALTIMKEDGTAFTTTQVLYSLTADEQSLINNLIKTVTASSDGVTFSKAVSFQGNESHNGSEIHNGYASFLGDENHAGSEMHKGTATFTDLRSDDLTATDGQELVSWDGTTTALKGKADRPTYNGGDLALKSDIIASSDDFVNAIGYLKYNSIKWNYDWESSADIVISDPLFASYNSYSRMFENSDSTGITSLTIPDMNTLAHLNANLMFYYAKGNILYVSNAVGSLHAQGMFSHSTYKKILVKEGCNCYLWYATDAFASCTNLTEVGAFDMSKCDNSYHYYQMFSGCPNLEYIHCKNWKFSFSLGPSTKFTEEALVEILNNLSPVSSTQTLTMGATNLAKLTSDDILIATGKGWALA